MNYDFDEGTIILALRRLYGYSQVEFCQFLSYSQPTLSKIENGTLSPDMSFVVQMARKLNLDLNIFKLGFISKIPSHLIQSKKNVFLSHRYLQNGNFSAKTTFFFLELVNENFNIDIYKSLGISKEYFVFSELKFSYLLFKDVLQFIEMKDIISTLDTARAKASALLAEDSVKACLFDLHLINIGNIIYDEDHYDISLHFEFHEEDVSLNEYFQHIIAFHILHQLNVNVKPIKAKKRNSEFVLRLYAS